MFKFYRFSFSLTVSVGDSTLGVWYLLIWQWKSVAHTTVSFSHTW